ncbi:MAG: oxygenase MpaB family protein, partial [Panacagrimonas sp.]
MGSSSPIEGFVPTRHRANPEMQKMLGLLHRLMPGVRPPSSELWNRMGRDFMRGDEPADRLIEWMAASGMRETRALFEQALEHGIDAVPDAPAPLRAFFAEVDTLPAWVDPAKLERGAEMHRRAGSAATYGGRDVALVGGYQASAFNKTLLLTGALEKGPARRFAETLRWALDCTAANGMSRFEAGFKSTLRVRLIHGLVRRHVQRLPDWRMEEWGLPINQPDMAATLLGALVVPLLVARVMGMPQTRPERDAAVHLARYVGWLMGVEERWLAKDEPEAFTLLSQLLLSLA